ncbi:hypothetical protein [Gracilimonas sediminicola]|uniref:Uncharacterized protein n=1 Tax=Gracilimonas sediminicola TaxID=2952158 RepID=A0A9X2RB36_9BACT|nr:hypothetical protein [Gracilimonas sediminicola]MCP9290036.1 hypothetical protein [Gracilimonas sediminicola]
MSGDDTIYDGDSFFELEYQAWTSQAEYGDVLRLRAYDMESLIRDVDKYRTDYQHKLNIDLKCTHLEITYYGNLRSVRYSMANRFLTGMEL